MITEAAGKQGKYFQNWSKTFDCRPELYFEPKCIDELKDILKQAKLNKRKVKVIGNGHSPSSIACSNDYLVSLKHFNNVLDIDSDKFQIKIEAGMLITKLNEILKDNDMALSVLGSISDQTIAGAFSCATHGSGKNYSVLSSYAIEVEMLLASGEVVKYSNTSNSKYFPVVLASLGSLGIILNLTIQCEKLFKLQQKQFGAKLDDVLKSLNVHMDSSDHFRFLWYPHTDAVICYHISRTNKPIHNPNNWFKNNFVGFYLLEFLLWISTFFNSLIPSLARFYYKISSKSSEVVDLSYNIFNFDCLFKQYVYEAAIPLHETAYFLLKLKSWLDNNPDIKVHFPVEVRFVKRDEIWLSNCYEQDSCYINIIMYRPYGKEVLYKKWWDYYEQLMLECNGRPHWAKAHTLKRVQLEKLYPKFNDFIEYRNFVDPEELFMNEYLYYIFG